MTDSLEKDDTHVVHVSLPAPSGVNVARNAKSKVKDLKLADETHATGPAKTPRGNRRLPVPAAVRETDITGAIVDTLAKDGGLATSMLGANASDLPRGKAIDGADLPVPATAGVAARPEKSVPSGVNVVSSDPTPSHDVEQFVIANVNMPAEDSGLRSTERGIPLAAEPLGWAPAAVPPRDSPDPRSAMLEAIRGVAHDKPKRQPKREVNR